MVVSGLHVRLECRPRDVPDPGCGNLAFLEHALAGRSRVESLVVVCVASPRARCAGTRMSVQATRCARWPKFGHRPARPLLSTPHIAGKGGHGALSSGCSADLPHLPASPYARFQGTLLQSVRPHRQVVDRALVCGGRCLAHPFPCWCHPACDLQVEHRVPLAVEQLSHGSW